MITINILAKHFKDTDYNDCQDCPVARAVKEHFKITDERVGVGGTNLYIRKGGTRTNYLIGTNGYGYDEYKEDMIEAQAIEESEGDGNTIIRTIELTETKYLI